MRILEQFFRDDRESSDRDVELFADIPASRLRILGLLPVLDPYLRKYGRDKIRLKLT